MRKKPEKKVAIYDRATLTRVLAAVNEILLVKDDLPPIVAHSMFRARRVLIWCLKHSCGPEKPSGAP
jgi:hypothetical protein